MPYIYHFRKIGTGFVTARFNERMGKMLNIHLSSLQNIRIMALCDVL